MYCVIFYDARLKPKGGVYSTFGGHDASRGLATFSVSGKDEYDDLSDLNSLELESMLEWETQFMGKYYILLSLNVIYMFRLVLETKFTIPT